MLVWRCSSRTAGPCLQIFYVLCVWCASGLRSVLGMPRAATHLFTAAGAGAGAAAAAAGFAPTGAEGQATEGPTTPDQLPVWDDESFVQVGTSSSNNTCSVLCGNECSSCAHCFICLLWLHVNSLWQFALRLFLVFARPLPAAPPSQHTVLPILNSACLCLLMLHAGRTRH